jgi:CMP-N-acetylneuraminic acid synthetase
MIKYLGVIPARGGSKTIPRKNIKLLNGKPLIAYTIEAALQSKLLSELIVSTDDEEIKEVAISYGAMVPFLRPKHLAGDTSTDLDVLKNVIGWYGKVRDLEIDKIVYLRPTTPFKTGELIDKCIDKFEVSNFSGFRTVTRVNGVHHPYWMYESDDGHLQSFIKEIDIADYYQRQLLPVCYRLNGVVDIMTSASIQNNLLYGENIGFEEVDEEQSVDIDTEQDFRYCEFLIREDNLWGR